MDYRYTPLIRVNEGRKRLVWTCVTKRPVHAPGGTKTGMAIEYLNAINCVIIFNYTLIITF